MTIQQIYHLGLDLGVKADPRGRSGVKRWLELKKKRFNDLAKSDKIFFDQENLTNPYADSRLHFGNPLKRVKRVLAGIEVEEAEIALAKTLKTKFDLIITHHPIGKALAALDEVMHLQADLMSALGVPINVAEGVMRERIQKVGRALSPANHMRAVDAARLAGFPIMNLHTPCDNLVFQFLQNLIEREKPETLAEIIKLLITIPEYRQAALNHAGPTIFAGNPENRAGKIVAFDITGGTEGAKEIYPELVKAGVGTVIGMHMREENLEEAQKNHLNVIIAGHISSDSLGMNLFLDQIEKQGVEIVPISGLIRVKRK